MRATRLLLLIPAMVIVLIVVLALRSGNGSMEGHRMPDGSTMTDSMSTPGSEQHSMAGTPMTSAEMDLAFIDSMIPHHESAIAMAEVARERSQRQEILTLADAIITTQQAEIDQLRAYRDAWFPDAAPTTGMAGMEDMAGMAMSDGELDALRGADPFDRAFIDAMIPHHESAIQMAHAILETTTRAELRTIAEAIVDAQQAEIDEMQRWRADWFGE